MPIEPIEPHLARWSLRRRILGLAAVALLALLAVSIAVVLVALRTILTQSAAATARGQSYELARLLEDGVEPAEAVREVPARGAVLQVLGAQGSAPTVLAASEVRIAGTSLVTALPATGHSMDETTEGAGGDGDTYAVAAQTVQTPDGVRTAVAARQLEVEFRTVETSTALLGVGGLVLGVLLLVLVDRIVRGALAPVTRITTQVGAITHATDGERVSVPPSGDEIATLATTMNAMLDRMARAETATRRFVSDASHELRSPLATLRTHVETARRPQDVDRELVHAEVLRLQALVDDLLMLAKSDDEGLRLDRGPLDLDDVVDEQVRRLRAVSTKQVSFELLPVEIDGDGARLGQVLRNLLDNADRHAVGAVRVVMADRPGTAVVYVDNDGPPVPPEARESVFDRFTRLDSSRVRDGGGSGLGLAIARTLAGLHDGSLTTGEAPDGWCRFTLTLPRTG